MRKTTLLLGITLLMLISTAQAQQAGYYQGGCGGAVIEVEAGNGTDEAECRTAGYNGSEFHCCSYSDCSVPEEEACEKESYLDCVQDYEGEGDFCQVLPTLDGEGYACCNCYGSEVGRCSDGVDNDCDGARDCDDEDCVEQCQECYAPCGDGCVYYTEEECEPQTFTCDQGCVCDTGESFDDMWGDYRITAEGTCKPGISSPEFSSLAILLTALLTAPAFAYLLIKKKSTTPP